MAGIFFLGAAVICGSVAWGLFESPNDPVAALAFGLTLIALGLVAREIGGRE